MRQRNIPVTEKVATEAQTDIQLVHDPVFFSTEQILSGSRMYSGLRQSHLVGAEGLIRPHTDSLMLAHLKQELELFKGVKSLEGVSQQDLKKRLLWIEQQLEGLEKRALSLMGGEGGQAGYYGILNDLQARLDRQSAIGNNYEPRLQKLTKRIQELESEVAGLRRALLKEQNTKDENEALKDAFRQVSEVVRDPKRMRDIERTVSTILSPLMDDVDVKLDVFLKNTTVMGRAATNPQNRLKTQINLLVKNLDKLVRSVDELTIENVDVVMQGFLKDLEVYQTFEEYAQGKLYKHLYDDLKSKFEVGVSIYKSRYDQLAKDFPNLASRLHINEMESLSEEGIFPIVSGNIVVLEPISAGGRTVFYQTLETRTKNLLNLMGRQFRRIVAKYPELRAEVGTQLYEYLTLEVFDDAVELEEMERIVEVVKYQTEVVKVENVYRYNEDKNRRTLFHMRIIIKTLLEELTKIKEKHGLVLDIDEGLVGLMRAEIEGLVDVNVDDVLRVFRSLPKIVQVEKIVEKDLGRYEGMLSQGHPINVESATIIDRAVEKPVVVKDQVGLFLEKEATQIAIHEKPIYLASERMVAVPAVKEKIVERVVTNEVPVQVPVIEQVPMKEITVEQVEKLVWKQRVIEVPKDVPVPVTYDTNSIVKQVVEIPRYEERLVEVKKQITTIKEVTVTEQVPIEIVKYVELEKIINNFVKVPQIVEIKEQVPVIVTNTIEKPVTIVEVVEKIVVEKVLQQKIIEVPVRHEVALIQEVPAPYKQEIIVIQKGDREEVFVEVERIVEKPVISEVLKLANVQVQKAVPVWLREEKPVIVEVNVPYIQKQPQIITLQVEKMIPYKEEVPVEVVREVPVPIVIEKEVIKQVRVIVEKVVEKIVEVPRVVEVERIVEKIVVVPRIIENIVQVPVIVEKIVEREVEVLKIVEVETTVPIYLTNEVKEIVKERTPYLVDRPVVEFVDKDKLVFMKEEREIIKEVEVERRIPVEVIRESVVQLITERIVDRLLTIHEVHVQDRTVVMPFKLQVPVELIQEKAVEVRKVIENVLQVPQLIEKNIVLMEIRKEPEIHKVFVDKLVEVEKEVVYTNTENFIEKQMVYTTLTKEVIVEVPIITEILKPEPFIVQKLVVTNEVHEEGTMVRLEIGVPYRNDKLVEVFQPVNHFIDREIPKHISTEKIVTLRTIVDNIKEVEVEGREKLIELQVTKPEVVQVTEQIVKYLNQEVEKRVVTQVPIREEIIKYVEVPGKTVLVHDYKETRTHNTEPVYAERIVERVVLLPQIVEILKHVHDISEIHALGVAVGVDVDLHRRDYLLVCKTLRESLDKLRASIRGSSQFQGQLVLVQELLPLIEQLIKFPTIVQVPKQVQKIVEKPVVVPTKDQESIDREIASAVLIEKLIEEIKRIRNSFQVDLKLDSDIMNIFFLELGNFENMEQKLQQFTRVVLDRFRALGNWTQDHSLMLNSFLQERFLMAGIIKECNDNVEALKLDLESEEANARRYNEAITKLNIHNLTLKNTLEEILQGLQAAVREDVVGGRTTVEGLLVRGRTLLESAKSDPLVQSRYLHAHADAHADNERLRSQIRLLESENQSFKGGESRRNGFLSTELTALKAQNGDLRAEIAKLRQSQGQERGDRRSQQLSKQVEQLNRQLHVQQDDFDRKYRRAKEDFEKQLQVKLTESRMVSPGEEEERLRYALRDMQVRVAELEGLLANSANENERIRFELNRKSVENEDFKKRLFDSQLTSEFQPLSGVHSAVRRPETGTTTPVQTSQMRGSQKPVRESAQSSRQKTDRPQPQTEEDPTPTGGIYQSPDVRGGSKHYTPAEQLKFQSPELRQVRTEQEPSEVESSSSRLSGQQLQSSQVRQGKRNLTIRQLMQDGPLNENAIAILIVRIVEKIQEETNRGRFMLYTPDTIHLLGFTPDHPELVKVKLGDPIDRGNPAARIYMSPEVLRGEPATERSSVFNIGAIWDEMLHGELYFHSTDELQNPGLEYRIRNNRINAIFKNTIFEMMAKDSKRRINFAEIKRRLSLQQFILVEETGELPRRRP